MEKHSIHEKQGIHVIMVYMKHGIHENMVCMKSWYTRKHGIHEKHDMHENMLCFFHFDISG